MNYNNLFKRYIAMVIIILLAGIVFFGRLINLQIVNGTKYEEAALLKSSNSSVVKAPRGEILDRYGRHLVTNRMAFSILIDKIKLGKNDLNTLIYNLIEFLIRTKWNLATPSYFFCSTI
jgi:penicillin-binding protein 2